MEGIIKAWGRILAGYQPNLSIEITRECPLTCPGCYAYGGDHLGGDVTLRELQDFKGQQLVDAMFALLDKHKPLHVSIVGGEPLVRYRELSEILPRMADMGIYTQLVTSAVRPIPIEWAGLRRLQLVVSIDGLQPEHDERRKPATYERILKHIEGHNIRVHCTVTRQQVRREGYLEEFAKFWSANPAVSQIWISLYTPQVGEISAERLTQGRPPESGRRPARDSGEVSRNCARRRRCSSPTCCLRTPRTTASSPRRRPACRQISRSRSRPASSAATPTARIAGALHLRRSRRSAVTSCRAAFRSGKLFDASFEIGNRVRAVRESFAVR